MFTYIGYLLQLMLLHVIARHLYFTIILLLCIPNADRKVTQKTTIKGCSQKYDEEAVGDFIMAV
jgi:hypothetical protein